MNYIKINKQTIKAIKKIIKSFPKETDDSDVNTPTKWINWVLNWYIRNLFTNGDDYFKDDYFN